jgi:hypothetical protein
MTPFSEVAADVLQALTIKMVKTEDTPGWVSLWPDGLNLIDSHWRCRCEDWLLEHNWRLCAFPAGEHFCEEGSEEGYTIEIDCPWPEFPARAVSAVWRRMKEATK